MFYRIMLPYATFGLEEKDGIVIKIAPVWKFALGWKIEKLKDYVEKKKGEMETI